MSIENQYYFYNFSLVNLRYVPSRSSSYMKLLFRLSKNFYQVYMKSHMREQL